MSKINAPVSWHDRSLETPDPTLDLQWLKEAEARLAAYRSGDLAAVDAKQVFDELGSHAE